MSDVKITPLARRLAEENGIDWKQMAGSNPDGTIVERDVLAFLAKVMAGEVDLPGSPDPEPSSPMPDVIPDFAQMQAALERQGVNLGDVMPKAAGPSVQTEEIPDLDLDFDLDLDEPLPMPDLEEPIFAAEPFAAEPFAAEPFAAEPFAAEPFAAEPAPLAASEPDNATWPEEPKMPSMTDWNLGAAAPEAQPAPSPEDNWGDLSFEAPPAPAAAKDPTLEEFVWDTAPAPVAPPAPAPVSALEPALTWEDVPAPPQVPATPQIAVPQAPAEPQAPAMPQTAAPLVQEAKPVVQPAPPLPVIEEPAPVPAPPVPPVMAAPVVAVAAAPIAAQPAAPQVQVWQRLVEVAGTFESAMHLAEAWKREVTAFPFLFRAAEKALADVDSPLRALKGSLHGDTLLSLRVPPSHTLRGTLESLEAASEPSEGLAVLTSEGSASDLTIFPGANVLSLGRATGGMAILSLHGSFEATQANALLDRVASYLERPILLA